MKLLSGDDRSLQKCKTLIARLSRHEQKNFLYSIIRILSKLHLAMEDSSQDPSREGQSKAIGGVAALIKAIVGHSPTLQDDLVEWLVGLSAEAVGQVRITHRAVTAALASIPSEYFDSNQHYLQLLTDFQNRPQQHCKKV